MNGVHNVLCSSGWWSRRVERELVPWGLDGVQLGDDVLEIGPGLGATTRVLAPRLERLTVLELDPGYCRRLRDELGNGKVEVIQGDAAAHQPPALDQTVAVVADPGTHVRSSAATSLTSAAPPAAARPRAGPRAW